MTKEVLETLVNWIQVNGAQGFTDNAPIREDTDGCE